jgi:hypothetical protein
LPVASFAVLSAGSLQLASLGSPAHRYIYNAWYLQLHEINYIFELSTKGTAIHAFALWNGTRLTITRNFGFRKRGIPKGNYDLALAPNYLIFCSAGAGRPMRVRF